MKTYNGIKLLGYRSGRRGVLLFGIIMVIAILGIVYFKGFTLFSTENRRAREHELDSRLSQMRKALDMAKNNENFRSDSDFEGLDEKTSSDDVQKKLVAALRNSSTYQRNKMDAKAVYLRQEFDAPMLEVDVDEKLNVGWRIAVNRVNSSSFEGENFMKIYRITEQSNVAQVNQWWFATTTENTLISIRSDSDKPSEADYPGQRDNSGAKGKYGKNVLQMKVK
jgi:type II secretory pathway pseudopilin PulG